ncbi:MAG: hypothetical protein HPY90_15150 [Syntrophothermus sp.]|uniref:hypothetical protein n=1 Tax=Syntrophothermus sp. TaxID=2736299 RepID=UPI00257A1707|nr:hypothetical protein [Syntrophothermus sp.]NSW84541.1 hypothetical protein [Syntrophothermus sp.]
MNQSELAALKEQIKAELMQEMGKAPKVRLPRPWDEVKEAFLPRLVKNDPYTQYQLTTAISTIIRYSLNVKNVSMLTYTQVERAKEIANKVLDVVEAATTEAVNQ